MATKVAELAVDITVNGASTAQQALKGVESSGRSVVASLSSLRGAALGATAALAATAVVLNKVTSTSDEYTRIAGRLKLVTANAKEAAAAQQAIFRTAQDTGAEFNVIANSFIRTAAAAKQLGESQQNVLTVTKALSQSLQINGASASEAAAVATQLTQALGSGTVAGDELKSIVENNLTLAQALADKLSGGNVSALRKLGAEGKLLSRDVFGAILAQAGRLDTQFKTMGGTFEQSATRLGNSFSAAINRVDSAIGVTKFLSRLLNGASSLIDGGSDGSSPTLSDARTPLPKPQGLNVAQERAYLAAAQEAARRKASGLRYAEAVNRQRNNGLDANPNPIGGTPRTGALESLASTIDAARAARRQQVRENLGDGVSSSVSDSVGLIESNITEQFGGLSNRINDVAQNIGSTFVDALSAGISTAVQSGSIGEGFRALTGTLLGGLGKMLIDFGQKAILTSALIGKFRLALASFNPVAGLAAGVGLVALGSVLVGLGQRAARSSFGGAGRSDGFSGGGFSIPTSVSSSSVFGAPSSIIADGRTPITSSGANVNAATPMVVNVFSPDDPTTQRFFRETLRRADGRGAF